MWGFDKEETWFQSPIRNRYVPQAQMADLQNAPQQLVQDLLTVTRLSHPADDTPGLQQLTGQHAYRQLDYAEGLVTYSPAAYPGGLITGWMSGCWLMRYKQGDATYLAHLGTGVGQEEVNKRVKRVWRDFAARDDVSDIWAFNPARAAAAAAVSAVAGCGMMPKIAGFVTPAGATRVLIFGQRMTDMAATAFLQLRSVVFAGLTPWEDVLASEEFQGID